MFLLEGLDLLEHGVGLFVDLVPLVFEGLDLVVVLVAELLVFLGLVHELAGLVVEGVSLPGELARGRVELVSPVLMLFRLGKNLFSLINQFVQHALPASWKYPGSDEWIYSRLPACPKRESLPTLEVTGHR